MAVLSISRQFGAGGWTLGRSISNQLGYKFVSSQIINEMAKEANVSTEWIKGVEKHAGDWLMRFVNKFVNGSFIEKHVGESKTDFDEKKYITFLQNIVTRIADEDNIVILGRGSQYILQGRENVVHLLLVADLEDRIKFLEKMWKLKKREAEKEIITREKRRDSFMKYFELGPPNSPNLYHMVLNTSKIDFDQAIKIVTNLVKDCEKKNKK
ncbi:MAG: cytidylate kinase-like family protein [Desulfobacteraceae bacterium]|jgi:cytidylate kinase